jgi:leader peptidase (prepilin peptidase) / N-methyltransferase
MEPALALVALAPGLAIGSFLNVVAARVPLRLSIVSPASSCPKCSTPIAWYDNVPLVSYVLLRGRCRACGWAIPWKYPAVEAATAVLVSASLARFGLTARGLVAVLLCSVLVAVTVTDLERRVIPNRIVLPAAAVVLVAQSAVDRSPEWAIAALAASTFLLLAALAYPGGMGMGDVKLALLLGAALGRTVAVALMIAFVAALVPAVWLIARHGAAARKMAVPFGPFLALGGAVALFAGDGILAAYLHLG